MRRLLPIIALLAAFAAHAQPPTPTPEGDVTFENQGLRLVIGPGGECKSLYDKTLRAERNCPTGRPLMQAVVGSSILPATSCAAQGNLVNVVFGDNQARAIIEVQTHPTFLGFVIHSYQPGDLEQLTLLDLVVTRQETLGTSFGVMYDSRAALGVQTLHFSGLQVLTASGPDQARLSCTYNRLARDRTALYRPPVARGCALLACPRAQLVPTLQAIEKTYGLPSPRIEGVWGKVSPAMRRSYLFVTDLTAANVDKVIAYAKRGRFGYVLLAQDSWSHGGGTFAINETGFPGGLPDLKATAGKLQQAGLKVGLHFLTAGMYATDPLVTPVPDKGIYSDATVPLAADIDETATSIPTASVPPVGVPRQPDDRPGADRTETLRGLMSRRGAPSCGSATNSSSMASRGASRRVASRTASVACGAPGPWLTGPASRSSTST